VSEGRGQRDATEGEARAAGSQGRERRDERGWMIRIILSIRFE
jgi:hypothetical protein